MIKTSFGFLAGVLAMAAVVYVAGARFAAPMFVAGVCAVLVPSIALLASTDRMRAFARFLTAFADAWQRKRQVRHVGPVGQVPSELFGNVTSALINMGTSRKQAQEAATAATQLHHEFDPAFRAALLLVPSSTRRAS